MAASHHDTKFTAQFDHVFETSGATIKRNTPVSPNLRAHVEQFIQSLKHERLDKFVIVAQRHLNHICREWSAHYNTERPHEFRDHLPPACAKPPEVIESIGTSDVVCKTRLGGLLNSYSRGVASGQFRHTAEPSTGIDVLGQRAGVARRCYLDYFLRERRTRMDRECSMEPSVPTASHLASRTNSREVSPAPWTGFGEESMGNSVDFGRNFHEPHEFRIVTSQS